ncbi:LysM peptidoglycan-binding domain-containing protein [Streptomyces sp. PRKS01-65]|nr:transglycosylase family protein [Streptomyces harenosi]NEY35507.1 LysM peptidoglycan-binding domain-containing protein [Streptomyces harenosi]
MLSGNGRHRRPRQAPALVVAAGVTGSAIAIPLLGASGAGAADGTAWDRVAECETGGAWSENSGNGYYGGLQLTQDDWEKYGGLAYASSADQASRSQQIRVAEKILAAQGITAWPTCGLLAGLNGSGPTAGATGTPGGSASTGSPESSASSGTPRSSDSSGSSSSASPSSPSSSADPSAAPDSSGDSTGPESVKSPGSAGSTGSTGSPESSSSPSASDTADPSSVEGNEPAKSGRTSDSASGAASGSSRTPGAPEGAGSDNSGHEGAISGLTDTGSSGGGRHRGPSAAEDPADRRGGASAGRHASRGEEAARDAVDGSYTVRHGDSLWAIADSLDLSGGWQGLYAENRETVGADPDHILPGQKLAVRDETGEN